MRKFSFMALSLLCAAAVCGADAPRPSNHGILSSTASGGTSTLPSHTADRTGSIASLNITGQHSVDVIATYPGPANPNNVVLLFNIAVMMGYPSGTPISMNGVGWNTKQEAYAPSWLSDMRLYFDDGNALNPPDGVGLFLTPGAGSNVPGVANFTSGGVIKLADVFIPDLVLTNGMLRLELYEAFDDFGGAAPGGTDGVYLAGLLRGDQSIIQVQGVALPSPGALSAFAIIGVWKSRRRRRELRP